MSSLPPPPQTEPEAVYAVVVAPARPAAAARRVSLRFMLSHPAHPIALGFGAGLAPWAPGTVGTLWAWAAFLLFREDFTDGSAAIALVVATLLGWWASTVTARHLNSPDPGAIVWDEVVAFWWVLFLVTPAGFWAQATAFALFRYFDAAKPGPVAWADRRYKARRGAPIGWRQGFGVMFDDLVAAGCTLLVIALWRWW
jgi:phosphatidylglycerophosphatase A